MYIDKELEFSDGQSVTTTAISTNVADIGVDADVGVGRPLWAVIQVDVALDDTTGDETYVVTLETDSVAALSSATVLGTKTFTRGDAAGTMAVIAVPDANEQFIGIRYTVGGTTPTGTWSAWLTDQEPTKWQSYADAI